MRVAPSLPGTASKCGPLHPILGGTQGFLSGSLSGGVATPGSHHARLESLEQHGELQGVLGGRGASLRIWPAGQWDLHRHTCSAQCSDGGAAGLQREPRMGILGRQQQPSSDPRGLSPPVPELGRSPGSEQGSLGTFGPALPRGRAFPGSLCGSLHLEWGPRERLTSRFQASFPHFTWKHHRTVSRPRWCLG